MLNVLLGRAARARVPVEHRLERRVRTAGTRRHRERVRRVVGRERRARVPAHECELRAPKLQRLDAGLVVRLRAWAAARLVCEAHPAERNGWKECLVVLIEGILYITLRGGGATRLPEQWREHRRGRRLERLRRSGGGGGVFSGAGASPSLGEKRAQSWTAVGRRQVAQQRVRIEGVQQCGRLL